MEIPRHAPSRPPPCLGTSWRSIRGKKARKQQQMSGEAGDLGTAMRSCRQQDQTHEQSFQVQPGKMKVLRPGIQRQREKPCLSLRHGPATLTEWTRSLRKKTVGTWDSSDPAVKTGPSRQEYLGQRSRTSARFVLEPGPSWRSSSWALREARMKKNQWVEQLGRLRKEMHRGPSPLYPPLPFMLCLTKHPWRYPCFVRESMKMLMFYKSSFKMLAKFTHFLWCLFCLADRSLPLMKF